MTYKKRDIIVLIVIVREEIESEKY